MIRRKTGTCRTSSYRFFIRCLIVRFGNSPDISPMHWCDSVRTTMRPHFERYGIRSSPWARLMPTMAPGMTSDHSGVPSTYGRLRWNPKGVGLATLL